MHLHGQLPRGGQHQQPAVGIRPGQKGQQIGQGFPRPGFRLDKCVLPLQQQGDGPLLNGSGGGDPLRGQPGDQRGGQPQFFKIHVRPRFSAA